MKRIIAATLTVTALLLTAKSQAAGYITLTNSDASGTNSFNTGLNWTNGLAPASGNAYYTTNYTLRTPATAGNYAFAGDSLSLDSGGGMNLKAAGTITITNLILNGGTLANGFGTGAIIAGKITNNGSSSKIDVQGYGRTTTINSPISGTGTITEVTGTGGSGAGTNGYVFLSASNAFSGQWLINDASNSAAGAPILNLTNANALANATLSLFTTNINSLQFSPTISTFTLGGLTGTGGFALTNTGGGNITLQVGNNNASTNYSGVMSGGGGLTMIGSGTLTLTGTNTYTGPTTISAGTLTIGGAGLLGSGNYTNTIANSGVLNYASSVAQTNGGVISGTGSVTQTGTGALTLSASNTYSGGTTFSNTLVVGAQGALGTGSVTGTSPAILQFNTPGNATFTNALTLAAPDNNSVNNQSTTATITLNGNIVGTAPNYFTLVGQGANNAGFVLGGSNYCTTRFVVKNAAVTLASNNAVASAFGSRISLGDSGGSGASVYLANGVTESLKVADANNNDINSAVFTVGMQSAGTSTFSGTGSSGVAVDLHARSTGGTSCAWNFEADSGATVTFSGIILNTGSNTNLPIAKTGAGTVVFSATNTYAGATTIQNGTLTGVVGGSCSNSAVTVAATTGNTATLGVSVTDITKKWTCSSLTVNNGGISSGLSFAFGALTPSTSVAPLTVTGAVTFTTAPTITITGSSLPASTGNGYPLLTWGSGGPANTNGMTLTLPFRAGGSLAVVGSTLYLQSSGSTDPLSWTGGNGTWDVSNIANNTIWKDNTSASTYYVDGDAVVFNNTVGSGGTVTLNTNVSPASVTVTNPTANYTISGSGSIAGSTGLTKSGAGTLTLTTSNSYTGTTLVNGGTLLLASNGSLASLTVTVNGGTLAVTNNATLATAAAITLNGGTLDLGSQNATNNQGNNNGISFGANGGNLNGTGIFYIIGTNAAATTITVAANGNAVVNENIWATNNLAGSYQNIASVGSGATLNLNGQVYSHTSGNGIFFSGGGTLVLNNPSNRFSTLGVNGSGGGTVSVTNFGALGVSGYLLMGQNTGNGPVTFIYAGPGTTASLAFESADLTPTILNNGSGAVTFSAANFTLPYGVPVSATPQTLALGGLADINILGVIQDANNKGTNGFNTSLVKTNANTLTLSGNNTYSGVTTVSGGTLLVNGSIGTNSVTVVNSGTVMGGSGTIGGSVTYGSGTLATNNEGSPLTISGSLTLNNNTLKVATPSALGAGDYNLISYNLTGSSGSFNATPVISGAGLAANTTGTIITGGGLVKLHVVLNTQPTTLVLDSSLNASTYGQTVTFTAAIKTNSVTAGNATSNVVFSVDGTPVTTNSLASGQAIYVTSWLSVPSHTISAIYVGDANYLPSTNSLTQTVNQAPLGITANNNNKTYNGVPFAGGNGVTYSGFVNGETPAVLGGSLSYGGSSQGATNAGSYTIIPSGQTSANYAVSYTNGTLTISPASTSVGAASTNNPSGYRDAVAFLATLPTDATGSVVFSSTNGPISTNLVTGVTTTSLSLTNLPRGTNLITVAYLGDGNYVGSTNTLEQIVTNHPPVVNPATYSRNAAVNQIKITVTNLLSNASDMDGDTLTLASVGGNTNPAAILMVSGGFVLYYNTNAVFDDFTYTVSDGYGGTNSATVTINVDSTPLFGQATIPEVNTPGGSATLNFAGIPGLSYSVQRSTNVTFIPVDTLWTTNAPSNGLFKYQDNGAPADKAFYRLQYNP